MLEISFLAYACGAFTLGRPSCHRGSNRPESWWLNCNLSIWRVSCSLLLFCLPWLFMQIDCVDRRLQEGPGNDLLAFPNESTNVVA